MAANNNRARIELEIFAVVVVRAATEMRALGYDTVIANFDAIHVVNGHVISNSDTLSSGQIPWCPYFGSWVDMRACPYFGAEQTQDEAAPSMKGPWAGEKKQSPYDIPDLASDSIPKGEGCFFVWVVVLDDHVGLKVISVSRLESYGMQELDE